MMRDKQNLFIVKQIALFFIVALILGFIYG